MQRLEQPSNVLLACVGLNIKRSKAQKITMNDLVHLFNKQKNLEKILIFSRKDVVKAFIEFRTVEAAQKAMEEYHGKKEKGLGKIHLYYSDSKKIDKNQPAIEYFAFPNRSREKEPNDLSKNEPENNIYKEEQEKTTTVKINSKENQNSLNLSSKNSNKRYFNYLYLQRSGPVDKYMINNQNRKRNKLVNRKNKEDRTRLLQLKNIEEKNCYNIVHPSRVILVSGISHLFKDTKSLLNLFGSIGIIDKILFMKETRKAFIEYQNVADATECITSLGELEIANERLKVCHSKQKSINFRNDGASFFMDYLEVKEDFKRNLRGLFKFSTALTQNILIIALNDQKLKFEDFCLALRHCYPLVSLNLLKRDRQSNYPEKWFLVAGFSSIDRAVYFMIKHNFTKIKGIALNLYFY